MQQICTYHIEIRGVLVKEQFNAESPMRVDFIFSTQEGTRFSIQADQTGMIGLVRHLHRQGFLLLSLNRESRVPCSTQEKEKTDENK